MVLRKKKKAAAAGKAGAKKAAKAAEAVDAAAELPSDEEPSDDEGRGAKSSRKREEDDDNDADFETPEEKRVRLAKEYLSKVGEGKDEADVQEHLLRDVQQQQRKARITISEFSLGEPRYLKGHKEVPTCVCLSSDERIVVSGGKDCALLKWDVETGTKDVFHPGGKSMFKCGGHFSFVMDVCMVEQRNLLISVGYDRMVRLWDTRLPPRTACVDALGGHQACATSVAAEPDGSKAYTVALDKSLRVWDLASRRSADSCFGHVSGVTCIDIHSTGRPVTGGVDKTARLWKVEKDTHLMFSKHTSPVDAVSWLDNESFVSGAQDGNVYMWSQSSKKPLANTSVGKGNWVTALGSVRMTSTFFCGSATGALRTWQVSRSTAENGKSSLQLVEAAPEVQLPGSINAMAVGRKLVVCAVGKEHRLGRWFYNRNQKNGIVFMPFSYNEA